MSTRTFQFESNALWLFLGDDLTRGQWIIGWWLLDYEHHLRLAFRPSVVIDHM